MLQRNNHALYTKSLVSTTPTLPKISIPIMLRKAAKRGRASGFASISTGWYFVRTYCISTLPFLDVIPNDMAVFVNVFVLIMYYTGLQPCGCSVGCHSQ